MPESYDDAQSFDLSVILPAFNEEEAIAGLIVEIRGAMVDWPGCWEIIAVDDGSTDRTAFVVAKEHVRVVSHIENRGYGAACKTGILSARGEAVAILDADGGHDPKALQEMLTHIARYPQVCGVRIGETGTSSRFRAIAKWMIRKLAEWISGKRIPDLNCGMRVFRRDIMLQYLWVLPEGFSASTSMTLALLSTGHAIKFVSIPYRQRIGRSKFHPFKDTFYYIATVLRLIMYFRPLRVFAPLSFCLGALAVISSCYGVLATPTGIHDADVILAVTAVQIMIVGLIADLIVAKQRGSCLVSAVRDPSPVDPIPVQGNPALRSGQKVVDPTHGRT